MMELVVLILGCFFAEIWILRAFKIGLEEYIDESLRELDQNLAQAVVSMAENGALAVQDPPNPMQMLLMQLVQSRMQLDIPRSEDGKFAPKPE